LAINSDTTINCAASYSGGTIRYKTYSHSSNFPNPAGTGFASASNIIALLAGWGTTGPAPLTISTTSLPNGTVGAQYNQTLVATGGNGSYTWSIPVGSLPTGLSLIQSTGVISGTPSVANTFNFTARVSDGSAIADKPLTIIINSGGTSQKLLGADDAPATLPLSANNLSLTRFRATGTGNMVTFKVKSDQTANVKVAIYADNASEPGALINSVNTGTPITAGWNYITIASSPIVSYTYYWLAINSDTTINCAASYSGGTIRYKAYSHSSNFPNPAGTGFASASNIIVLLAGINAPLQKMVGADDAAATLPLGAGSFSLTRFQAAATGNTVTFKIKSSAPANVKVAIYADNAGEPGALINSVNTGTPITAGWNSIAIASTAVTSGNFYWLAINSDTQINCAASSLGGTIRYKVAAYSGFAFPNPAGTGFSQSSGIIALLAGWGYIGQ